MKIGEMIHKKEFSTYVSNQTMCTSACALIWIAGKDRSAASTARIGFHAAYEMIDGKPVEKGSGNAIIGSYLTRLGLSYEAISFATSAAPNQMAWVTPEAATTIGIPYTPQMDNVVTLTTVAAPQPTVPVAQVAPMQIQPAVPTVIPAPRAARRFLAKRQEPQTIQDRLNDWFLGAPSKIPDNRVISPVVPAPFD